MNRWEIQQNALVRGREEMRGQVEVAVPVSDGKGPVVCPKPRRVGFLAGNLTMSLRWQRSQQAEICDSKAGAKLLDLILMRKLWKRLCAEVSTEVHLLVENWKYILGGILFQYIHGLAARGVHYIHRPGPTLQDAGFFLLPELGRDKAYISETVFASIFFSFVLWTFHPFILKSKKIYTVLIWCRVLAFLAASQFLRIITFYSTQLPGPNYHCREGSKLATLPPPKSALDFLVIKFPGGVLYGCGDLIFSSHMIFSLVFIRTYQKYGTKRWIKQLSWLLAVVQSLLIIASRKHYTVDVVVAWYTVNLVVFFVDSKLPEISDRSSTGASLLLPLSNKEKDGRNKEENHKLLNGNSVDPMDRRQRNGMNGKIVDDGLTLHNDNGMNV